MVQAYCTPGNHIGDFEFDCSNKECRNGPNGDRFALCEYCVFKDKAATTLLHCVLCHIKFQREDKKEEEDSDDDDDAWFKMIKRKYVEVQTPSALKLMADLYKANPQYF